MKRVPVFIFIFGLAAVSCRHVVHQNDDIEFIPVKSHQKSRDSGKLAQIIRGRETIPYEYPIMVSVAVEGTHTCGGTILTKWHVLTAAHCTYNVPAKHISVRTGAHDLDLDEGYVYRVAKNIIHPKYSEKHLANDIAMLVTATKIRFDEFVIPACMLSWKPDLIGEPVKAIGWGSTRDSGNPSSVLKEVDLHVLPFSKCSKAWRYSGLKPTPRKNTNICTDEFRKGTCQGDSGGPLLWLDPNTERYVLVAIVSYGSECAGPLPGINTDVLAYNEWILQVMDYTRPAAGLCILS